MSRTARAVQIEPKEETPPVIHWVDEDYAFVELHYFHMGREGYRIQHYPDASHAYRALANDGVRGRELLIIDVMLDPGADKDLFSPQDGFEEEQMGLLLYERLRARLGAAEKLPVVIYTGRAKGAFRQRVEEFCKQRGLEYFWKDAEQPARDFVSRLIALFNKVHGR